MPPPRRRLDVPEAHQPAGGSWNFQHKSSHRHPKYIVVLLRACNALSHDVVDENMQKLKSGDLYEVARVIKGLLRRDNERGLSSGERKMLHTAKQILISEMVLSMGQDYQAIEDLITTAMTGGIAL